MTSTTTYNYDIANRLTDANGITYVYETKRIDDVGLGRLGTSIGTRGTLYFDSYESHRGSAIGLVTGGPTLQPALTNIVMVDGFDKGDISAWESADNVSGGLSISAAAAHAGGYGMQTMLNPNNNVVLYDDAPDAENYFRARFDLNPNGATIPSQLTLWDAERSGWKVWLDFKSSGSNYQYQLCAKNDALTTICSSQVNTTNGWQTVEVEWQTASAPGANNGFVNLRLNGSLVSTISNLDSDTLCLEWAALGAMNIPTGSSGTLYFDSYESYRAPAGSGGGALTTPTDGSELVAPPSTSVDVNSFVPQNGFFQPVAFKPQFNLPVMPLLQQQFSTTTISYIYDSLYRLKEANYSNGDYYHYTYDAVGNRLTQETMLGGQLSVISYQYDNANRLVSVDGVTYVYDNNGNLLNDGVNTYTYDSANRLKMFSNQSTVSSYQYNGLGDRLSQTVNGVTTNYTLDLNAGLTQVLSDGTKVYVYGNGRIAQVSATTEYFLGDALGSVRQLTNASGQVTLAKSYTPYGETRSSVGSGTSIYSYTGEQQDVSGLTYLRARYYSSGTGRFLTRDTWGGDENSPMSFNRWLYVEGNPINSTDPSGHSGMGPWCKNNFPSRADAAEKYVDRSAFGDYLNTYTAAGIGVQCWGRNYAYKDFDNSGYGIAQITNNAASTELGKPIYEYDIFGNQKYKREGFLNLYIKLDKNGHPIPIIRGYGLRCPDPASGELEEPLDQNVDENAVILMRREIKLVTDVCGNKGCTPTDIYIAAALAQNGPGFNLQNIKDLTSPKALLKNGDVIINWVAYFNNDNNADDTRDQLILFDGVIQELRKRNWYIPDIKWDVVNELKKIGDF